MSAVIENHHDDHHHGPAKGLSRWLHNQPQRYWYFILMVLICHVPSWRSNGYDYKSRVIPAWNANR